MISCENYFFGDPTLEK